MIKTLRKSIHLLQAFGPAWVASRATYAVQMRLGTMQRRLPASTWQAQPLANLLRSPGLAEPAAYYDYRRSQSTPRFFFTSEDRTKFQPLFERWDEATTGASQRADELRQGIVRYFERTPVTTGFPPPWHTNPFTGQQAPADHHWSAIGDFAQGDIKVIWEPSRFGFVYPLVRAYWRSGDEAYAELFWQAVEDWQRSNPPQQGPNWKCGQETSIRVFAWCFGLYGMLDARASSPERVALLAQMIAISGQRIEANLEYALNQRNNHSISECVGLFTIGTLFPELSRAAKWRDMARSLLEKLGQQLIYDDGSFVQHAVIYHRLMLHAYLWALRLAELHNQHFSARLKERVANSGEFLYQMQDADTGQVPYYGQNDGSLILALDNCDYLDFRPVIQATHYFARGTRCYAAGPWDEDLLWLFGPAALDAPTIASERTNLQADTGGYYTFRDRSGFAFVRCASFRDRPSQADMLHMDLWWRGQNIAVDAGTYSYNAPDPWNNSLASTVYHNTVGVDSLEQMERAGKFLWLPWLTSRLRMYRRSTGEQLTYWEGEHDGYQRLEQPARHVRGILQLAEGAWLVLDRLSSQQEHDYRLHWLFQDWPYAWDSPTGTLALETPAGDYYARMMTLSRDWNYSLVRADEASSRGWRSQYYHDRIPALSIDLVTHGDSVLFLTLFGPEKYHFAVHGTDLQIDSEHWRATVALGTYQTPEQTLIVSARLSGSINEELKIA